MACKINTYLDLYLSSSVLYFWLKFPCFSFYYRGGNMKADGTYPKLQIIVVSYGGGGGH